MRVFTACVLLILAFTRVAAAGPLEQGDALARWGAYRDADAAYRKVPGALGLSRRLAVAEVLGDAAAVRSLCDALVSEKSPDVRLRVAFARAGVAVRTGRVAEGRKWMQQATALAAETPGAAGLLARYICDTYAYAERVAREGRPTPAAFLQASGKAWAPLQTLSPTQAYLPLDNLRAAAWGRYWSLEPMEYCADALREKDAAAAKAWFDAANAVAVSGRTILLARALAASDPEAGYVALHVSIDLAQGFWYNPAYAEPILNGIETEMANGDRLLVAVAQSLGGQPRFLEQARCRARYLKARARVAMARGAPASGLMRDALAAFIAAEQPVDAADTASELAAALLVEKSPERAVQAAADAIRESRRLGYRIGLVVGLYWEGSARAAQGDLERAEAALREAVSTGEAMISEVGAADQGRVEMVHRMAPLYELLVDVLIRRGKQEEAMETAARRQSGMLLAALDVAKVKPRDPAAATALRRVEETRTRSTELEDALRSARARPPDAADPGAERKLEGEIASNRQQFYQALNALRAADPEYERLVAVRPTAFAKLQPALPADVVLAQYFPAAERLYVFVATRDELKIRTVDTPRDALERDVRLVRRALSRPPKGQLEKEVADALTRLHQALVEPVEPELGSRSVLAVIPSGMLYYLPFSALARRTAAGLEYLAQRKAVAVLTQLDLLEVVTKGAARGRGSVLAIGNPDGSLPGAETEVRELGALFPKATVLVGKQATEERLAHPGTDVVHVATHGILDTRDLNDSYLLMAQGGRLTTGEIYGLDLRGVDLVTLSACQTGLGERQPGAEIASLAQAFSVAGSRTLLASLWSVSDRATLALMRAFYGELKAGTGVAEGLRRAQVGLIAAPETAHPFFWSAFEAIGDWR